jgi:syndecan 4
VTFPTMSNCSASTTCSGHGSCQPDNTCSCYNSPSLGYYTGLRCDVCLPPFHGVGCANRTCAVGTPSCVKGTCSSVTTCGCFDDGVNGHWGGDTCNVCAQDVVRGFWSGPTCSVCKDGFQGEKCTTICDPSVNCNGHGTCASQGCVCDVNAMRGYWTGSNCSVCAMPYFGALCTSLCTASSTCSGHGTCGHGVAGNGLCVCINDPYIGLWIGVDCSSCMHGYHGKYCIEQCPGSSSNPWLLEQAARPTLLLAVHYNAHPGSGVRRKHSDVRVLFREIWPLWCRRVVFVRPRLGRSPEQT